MSDKKMFTLGIEEEFQIIDPETRELKSHIQQIIQGTKQPRLAEQLKPELHQSVVEIGTRVCANIKEAREDLFELRSQLAKTARESGMAIAAAGTHPFSHWKDQLITNHPRYKDIIKDMQMVARGNLIFGLHVHVGIEDREDAIQIMNAARYFVPHILALSTNSPFWLGRNTGFKSYRVKVFDRFPRTGLPDLFDSLAVYENFLKLLVKTNCIDDAKKIWWDIRLHPYFDTLEFRICDIPMRADESLALAALFQAIVAKLHKLKKQNLGFRLYRRSLILENKWRASRYGLDGKLIDFGKQEEVNTRDLVQEIIEFVGEEIVELGTEDEIKTIRKIVDEGTGADRQLAVWEQTNDLKRVVDYIIDETHQGLVV
ncbi:MAG TPA: carboxylate-amine ligase [Calditrichia bacterium]|nr:carboxylate-amine ligase [Calditrichota bacterium]HQU72599.1 carboxylate-amine ligase [Calditrichia bacterium]HQV33521.1 carboxylate-amine ligase [Calditrichia bacterium]